MAYLMVAEAQYKDKSFPSSYNVGPHDSDCWTTGELVQLFCYKWNAAVEGDGANLCKASWVNKHDGSPHEANILKLDCSKLKITYGWKLSWNVEYSGLVFKTKYLSFYNESMLRVEREPLHHCNQGYAA